MKHTLSLILRIVICEIIVLLWLNPMARALSPKNDKKSAENTLQDATAVFQQMDKRIPENVFAGAECVIVVPHASKSKVAIGSNHANGAFTCRTGEQWSAPGFITLMSPNSQIGSSNNDVVLLVMNDNHALTTGDFKLGANVSVGAGPVGRDAEAATDWLRNTQVLTYSRSHGLFAGIDLIGSEVKYDRASVAALYGKDVNVQSVVNGQVATASDKAENFVKTVSKMGSTAAGDGHEDIPTFPWPPPEASASEVIPSAMLAGTTPPRVLGDINTRLVSALNGNGYLERSYYAVPGGFALVTRLEQIQADGTSKQPPDRWSVTAQQTSKFTLREYLRALFTANPAYYRLIIFVVSDVPFTQSSRQVSSSEAIGWLRSGVNFLPPNIAARSYDQNSVATALIYEFDKEQGQQGKLILPSHLDCQSHLTKSGLWGALGGRP